MDSMNNHEKQYRSPKPDGPVPESHPAKPLRLGHYCILALPFMGLLWPPFYARWTPEVFGIPFFYVYQFAWIPASAALTAVVYRNIYR
jgi:hypothetical protein